MAAIATMITVTTLYDTLHFVVWSGYGRHRKRVRSLKECESSGARDGNKDGCTSHVHASSIHLSSLARPDRFCGSPGGHAVFDETFEEVD